MDIEESLSADAGNLNCDSEYGVFSNHRPPAIQFATTRRVRPYVRNTRLRAPSTPDGHRISARVPTARIVELTGANLFMFLSNEADVLREIRAFAAT